MSRAVLFLVAAGCLTTGVATVRAELGHRGIRVSCIRPGAVFTEINVRAGIADAAAARQRLDDMVGAHALRRIGQPEEIAEGIEYLARAEWATELPPNPFYTWMVLSWQARPRDFVAQIERRRKHQIPTPKHQRNPNTPSSNTTSARDECGLVIGAWSFLGIWCLGFGIYSVGSITRPRTRRICV